eukprot:10461167-Prorocentrum_lima.AAC.1
MCRAMHCHAACDVQSAINVVARAGHNSVAPGADRGSCHDIIFCPMNLNMLPQPIFLPCKKLGKAN